MDETPDIFGHAFQLKATERLLRDPLHGLIAIDESTPQGRLITALIDAPEFQRLRRIRQLGLAHLAFQGAEHSRFTHSIGAFHLVRRICEHLSRMYAIDSELAFYASVAALVHDLGHGPFSHVSERIFGLPHEQWTIRILHDPSTRVNQALSDYARNLPSIVESTLTGMAKPGYLSSLVGSQLDADRLDYLLRDSLMTGVKYGVYDLDRLIHMLRISPEGDQIVVAEPGLVPVEKYLQARYHMYRQVYLHKTVIAAEAMLIALMRRAADLLTRGEGRREGIDPALARALAGPLPLSVSEYLTLDDVTVMSHLGRWREDSDPVLSDLAGRLLDRRLFKSLEISPDAQGFNEKIQLAEKAIKKAGLDPAYYLLRTEFADTPYRPYDPSGTKPYDHIYIETPGGRATDVAERSPTLRAFTQSSYTMSRLIFPDHAGGRDLRAEIKGIFG